MPTEALIQAFLVGRDAYLTTPLAYQGLLDQDTAQLRFQIAEVDSQVWADWLTVDQVGTVQIPNLDVTGYLFSWTQITGTPTSLAGYGITDPVVLTSGSYADPAWITSLAASKLTGTATLTSVIAPNLYGSTVANGDLTIEGTSHATKASSYVLLQPNGGLVGVGPTTPTVALDVAFDQSGQITPVILARNTHATAGGELAATFGMYAPNLDDGSGAYMFLGRTASANNRAAWIYFHVAAGSASNYQAFGFFGVAVHPLTVTASSRIGISNAAPTARLHLPAGTATANTAPLKFISGAVLTTAEAGAVEFLTDAFYGTITTGTARKTFAFLESPAFTGTTTFAGPLTLKGYTVATLPVGAVGQCAYCTDLLAPGFLVAVVGGGAVVGPVFHNGVNWVAF